MDHGADGVSNLERLEAIGMNRRHFLKSPSGISVREIAELTGAEPVGDAPLDRIVTDVAQIDQAGPSALTFLAGVKYTAALRRTRAGACLIEERFQRFAPPGIALLRTAQPYAAFARVARMLFPDMTRPTSIFETVGVAPGAMVHPTARLEPGVTVDPRAVIGPRAGVGAGTIIGATARIGPDVQIGRDCFVGPGAAVTHALIGDRVIVHAGCCIGQFGFRFDSSPRGRVGGPQVGRVIIQDDVEIGANTTIDRGSAGDTVIGAGTKIDNLVQIGHNVAVGRQCLVVSECCVSGGVKLGDYVVLTGQVGIEDDLNIGEGSMIGAKAGVTSDVPAGERWVGYPALPVREAFRMMMMLQRRR